MENIKQTSETYHNFKDVQSMVGTTWAYYNSFHSGNKPHYLLRVTDVHQFVWLVYGGRTDHNFCDPDRKPWFLSSPQDLGGYQRVIMTPDDPHAETDF
jgi:hypothetical protein